MTNSFSMLEGEKDGNVRRARAVRRNLTSHCLPLSFSSLVPSKSPSSSSLFFAPSLTYSPTPLSLLLLTLSLFLFPLSLLFHM